MLGGADMSCGSQNGVFPSTVQTFVALPRPSLVELKFGIIVGCSSPLF